MTASPYEKAGRAAMWVLNETGRPMVHAEVRGCLEDRYSSEDIGRGLAKMKKLGLVEKVKQRHAGGGAQHAWQLAPKGQLWIEDRQLKRRAYEVAAQSPDPSSPVRE